MVRFAPPPEVGLSRGLQRELPATVWFEQHRSPARAAAWLNRLFDHGRLHGRYSHSMKLLASSLAAAVLLGSAPDLLAFAQIARGQLLLSTSATATYDSRVLGGIAENDDFYFTLNPRLLYSRDAAQIRTRAFAGVRINRYIDYSEFDSEDVESEVDFRIPAGTISQSAGGISFGYVEGRDVDYDVNRRIARKTFTSRIDFKIPTGLKTELEFDAGYSDERRQLVSDRESWDGAVAYRYRDFLYGTDLALRYRYLRTRTSGENMMAVGLDQHTDRYTIELSRPIYASIIGSLSYGYRVLDRSSRETLIGQTRDTGSIFTAEIRGPFLPESLFPKLQSSFSIAYQESETPGLNDTGKRSTVGSMDVKWSARERTALSFNARRGFELSSEDLTVETTSAQLGISQEIGYSLSADASVGYERRDYTNVGREDDVILSQVSAILRVSAPWSVRADYRYRQSSSNVAIADYERHIAMLTATYVF